MLIMNLVVALVAYRWTQLWAVDQLVLLETMKRKTLDRYLYFQWRAWVATYALGQAVMCVKLLFNYALWEGKYPRIMIARKLFFGQQTKKIVFCKILLNLLSLVFIYFALAPFAVKRGDWRFGAKGPRTFSQWISLLYMFPFLTGFCFYAKRLSEWWFIVWVSEFKQVLYEVHYLFYKHFKSCFFIIKENKDNRLGYLIGDVALVSGSMFIARIAYLIFKPVKEIF